MSQPRILLINGAINAGKTTVSKAICARLPNTAHVEVDALHACIEWMPLEESIPLNLKNAVAITRNFVEHGLSVVLSYPLNPEDFAYLTTQLQGYPIECVTLSPPLEVAQRNRGTRELTAWEYERIAFHYATGIANPAYPSIIIDNSRQTPDETAQQILDRLKHTE